MNSTFPVYPPPEAQCLSSRAIQGVPSLFPEVRFTAKDMKHSRISWNKHRTFLADPFSSECSISSLPLLAAQQPSVRRVDHPVLLVTFTKDTLWLRVMSPCFHESFA
ncbi:hypothetical protein NPIL_284651 [Nephila pilipes]|uniref:Uncharacterized protein n=1 Tax=Nephila pilipes TaxID=299642 RepID=A0A8X6MS18_NEPPI|nr:hypothetical protein NPIL_284651 [Nephila pilipes]